jgi:predicted AAA+ superfamily ATPase
MNYRNRIIEKQIGRALSAAGAVVIEGPKACGKTSTGLYLSKSNVRLDRDAAQREVGTQNPALLLDGSTPRLIDEWQLVPSIWNTVRNEVDDRAKKGQFILTGSAAPTDDATRHSGAGRFIKITMRPMTLSEVGQSNESVSLASLFDKKQIDGLQQGITTERDIADLICTGGWPTNLGLPAETCMLINKGYIKAIASTDIITLDGKRRDPLKVEALIRSFSRNVATYASNKTLQLDSESFGATVDTKTLTNYVDALERLFVITNQREWGTHIRSSATLRKKPKKYLIDPSLAVAALDMYPNDVLSDRETFGLLFENLVQRDLAVYADSFDAVLRSYHDSNEDEIDMVIVKGEKWAGIEVKLAASTQQAEPYFEKLKNIALQMRTKPQFLAIITATGPSYTRSDGVHLISLTHLTA